MMMTAKKCERVKNKKIFFSGRFFLPAKMRHVKVVRVFKIVYSVRRREKQPPPLDLFSSSSTHTIIKKEILYPIEYQCITFTFRIDLIVHR